MAETTIQGDDLGTGSGETVAPIAEFRIRQGKVQGMPATALGTAIVMLQMVADMQGVVRLHLDSRAT